MKIGVMRVTPLSYPRGMHVKSDLKRGENFSYFNHEECVSIPVRYGQVELDIFPYPTEDPESLLFQSALLPSSLPFFHIRTMDEEKAALHPSTASMEGETFHLCDDESDQIHERFECCICL